MTRLEQWQQVKNSEDGKLFAVEKDGIVLQAWEESLSTDESNSGNLMHDYLCFKHGFQIAAIRMIKATGILG